MTSLFCFCFSLIGEEMVYVSADSIDPFDLEPNNNLVFIPDFFNIILLYGLPNHSLCLRVVAQIMFLRNIDPKGGKCNGTKLQMTQMTNHVLETMLLREIELIKRYLIP